ncbi:restriction endonuclease subunit S [Paenarthrobacter sp. NPDC089675]|uniref:restriction endonuclease subunit S n=1 Tax=Paenarthrobacter sp. NPDC089675 TaxID=3364376 RepID=UPI0037F94BD2
MSTPEGWQVQPLSEVVSIQRGFDLPHHARRPGPFPVLTSGETGGFHDEGPVRGPGVTIGRATNLGQPKWSEGDFWPHNTTMFVKDFKGNLPRWVFHYFENTDLAGYDSGSVQPMLNRNYIAQVPVLVPPFDEQQAIAEVLGALDNKIAANTKLATSIAELATIHFSHVNQDADQTVLLSKLVATQYGVTTSAHAEPGPRFLRVTDINKKPWIEWDSTPNCTVSHAELAKYRVSPGDILVARMADPGKAAFIDSGDPEAVFASYLVRLKPHDPVQALYLYYFLRSPQYLEYAEGAMTGSVQKNMNAKVIVATDVALPGHDVLVGFNETVEPLRALIQSHLNENRKLTATRDALLPQLMSGKLRVKDAEKVLEDVGV